MSPTRYLRNKDSDRGMFGVGLAVEAGIPFLWYTGVEC
jgi:hypothetical protein